MDDVVETSWWLDHSGLPDQLIWARLQVAVNGRATILDIDGCLHEFPNLEEADIWMGDGEYMSFDDLVEEGEIDESVLPPKWEDT